ncbi:hypothetical protein Tco_1397532, partial [Tanacetum coccineum]
KIKKGIEHYFAKIYTDNKSTLKAEHWVANSDDRTYNVEGIRSRRPANISSTVICRLGSQSLAVLRDRKMESFENQEYPFLIQTYFNTHTIDDIFLRDEDRLLYEEMLRLQGLGSNTSTGVPYTDNQIMAIVRHGKQQGHILGVGRVLAGKGRDVLMSREPRCTHTADVDELKRTNKQLKKQIDMIMKHEVGSGSGSSGGGDDEPGDNEDANEDEEDADSEIWKSDKKQGKKDSKWKEILPKLELQRNTISSYAVTMKIPKYGMKITYIWNDIEGLIPINKGLIQAIPTSLPPQPIGEATKASNLRRSPPGVKGDHTFLTFYAENVDIETLTIEQYLALDLNNARRKFTYPNDSTFEVKGQLLRELRKISFSGSRTNSVVEHISNVFEIASIFNAQESTLIQVFLLILEGIAKRWFERTSTECMKSWSNLKQNFIRRFCPPAMLFQQLSEI